MRLFIETSPECQRCRSPLTVRPHVSSDGKWPSQQPNPKKLPGSCTAPSGGEKGTAPQHSDFLGSPRPPNLPAQHLLSGSTNPADLGPANRPTSPVPRATMEKGVRPEGSPGPPTTPVQNGPLGPHACGIQDRSGTAGGKRGSGKRGCPHPANHTHRPALKAGRDLWASGGPHGCPLGQPPPPQRQAVPAQASRSQEGTRGPIWVVLLSPKACHLAHEQQLALTPSGNRQLCTVPSPVPGPAEVSSSLCLTQGPIMAASCQRPQLLAPTWQGSAGRDPLQEALGRGAQPGTPPSTHTPCPQALPGPQLVPNRRLLGARLRQAVQALLGSAGHNTVALTARPWVPAGKAPSQELGKPHHTPWTQAQRRAGLL